MVRNVFRIDEHAIVMTPRILRATRWWTLPMAALAAVVALRVPQTGILLTLSFDLLLASLVVPFIFGLYWSRGGAAAATAAIVVGGAVRLTYFVLTPTIYGVDNTLLYFPNEWVSTAVDGWSTLLAGAASLVAYVVVALMTTPPATPDEPETAVEAEPATLTAARP